MYCGWLLLRFQRKVRREDFPRCITGLRQTTTVVIRVGFEIWLEFVVKVKRNLFDDAVVFGWLGIGDAALGVAVALRSILSIGDTAERLAGCF